MFLVCSLRTNVVFVLIFLTLVFAFSCLAGAYFNLALFYENNMNLSASVTASRLVVVCYNNRPLVLDTGSDSWL